MPPPAPTRTRLDQLIDLLAPATFTRQQYLNALRQNEQDVQRAAEWLLLADVDVVVDGALKKKTSGRGLKEWLKSSANTAVPRRRITVNGSTECITLDTSDDSDDDEADLEILHASTSPPTKGNLPPLNPPTATKKRKLLSGASFMAHLTSNNHSTPPLPTRKPGERPLHLRSTFSSPSETTITYTHLPTLTLHRSPLPPALASALFLQLMRETDSFERHEWFLAGRYVTSPHTSRYYHSEGLERDDEVAAKQAGLESDAGKDGKQQGNQYWYAGKQVQPAPVFPNLLQKAADLVTPFVNEILAARSRYPGEYSGEWRASYAAVNHYQGAGSSVGWHADQLTYLGPYATIVSLSLGTPREFRLRPSTNPTHPTLDVLGHPLRTYAITLPHNSIAIMHAGTQELYKHTVVPHTSGSLDLFKPSFDEKQRWVEPCERKGYNSRINITFRFYREDFRPYPRLCSVLAPALAQGLDKGREASEGRVKREGTPICRCGIPTILRADQKGKVRASQPPPPPATFITPTTATSTNNIKHNDERDDNEERSPLDRVLYGMVYFWQCQSSSITGTEKGCGFFRILDMKAEGRGPCFGDVEGR